MDYPVGDMSISLLTKVTKQLPSNIDVVAFFRGEPLLNPHFTEAMTLLEKFNVVQLATNGDYLTKTNRKAILDTCTFVSLSLHEFLFPHQTRFPSFLYECLGAGIETQISILDSLIDESKIARFIREWRLHTDRVRIYKTHSQDGFGNMGVIVNDRCDKPFEELVVFWDGKVGLCNHDWNGSFPLGDLNKQTINQVWNHSNYAGVRELHEMGLRRAVPTCEFCSFRSKKIYGELIKNGRQKLHNQKIA